MGGSGGCQAVLLVETRHLNRRIGRLADYLDRRPPRLFGVAGDPTPSTPPARWNTAHAAALSFGTKQSPGSMSVANNKDANQKQPGEKEPGKYHYNPGNMSEKTIDSGKPESQQRANIDRIKSRGEQPHTRDD
jgi:hypothetical protein